MLTIRPEQPADRVAVREVLRQAFEADLEADLVERLWRDGDVITALVAEDAGSVVGHVLFSDLALQGARIGRRLVALAPLAVRPDHQGRGLGRALVEQGLDACRRVGVAGVFVLGEPDFYARFGFTARAALGVSSPFSGDAFMALPLRPGALDGLECSLHYPSAFGLNAA